MKLSEMSTEKAFDAMLKMLPHFAAIAEDTELKEMKKDVRENRESVTNAQLLARVIPVIAERHRKEVFAIVAITDETDAQSVGNKPFGETLLAFQNALEELMDFFPVCLRLAASA